MCVGVEREHIVPDVVFNKPEGPVETNIQMFIIRQKGRSSDAHKQMKSVESRIDHTFYGFRGVITHEGCWENTRKCTSFLSVLPTSQVGYYTGKPIESVVYCFYEITLSKTMSLPAQ